MEFVMFRCLKCYRVVKKIMKFGFVFIYVYSVKISFMYVVYIIFRSVSVLNVLWFIFVDRSVSVWVSIMLNIVWDRLFLLFILVVVIVLDLFFLFMRLLIFYINKLENLVFFLIFLFRVR